MTQTVKVIPVELTEMRAASTASGGSALTTTLSLIDVATPGWGADYISLTPRNFAGCAVVKYALNPYLTIFHTQDAGITVSDLSDEMQDGDTTSTAFTTFAITGTGYMYVGADVPFRGVSVELGTNKNDTASVITVKYWHGGAWVDISDTDGTDVAGDSMKQSGDVTWTVPTDWASTSLSAIGDTLPSTAPHLHEDKYWTRWEWSAALDSVDVDRMQALNRATTYAELVDGQTVEFKMTPRTIGCIEALTNAGTANLVVNVGTLPGSEFE
jgi:hypothetical protein